MSVLTITGDRQAGKSYTLCLLAIDAAVKGDWVFYVCESRAEARQRLDDVSARCKRFGLLEKVWLAIGEQRIKLRNGAYIYFGIAADRGHNVKVRLLDNVLDPDHPDLYIGAERVIRAITGPL